jgi:phosphatidylglycerophosphate synthase
MGLAVMLDPVNRFYRYPLAARLLPAVAATPVTPNQITALHTLLGLGAAACVWRGSGAAVLLAGLLWELHLVLDCLDGVLARARGNASDHGRTLDILGDTVAYLALAAAMAGYVRATAPGFPAGAVTVAMIVSGALAAWAHDFFSRKITAALTSGTDPVYEALLARHRAVTTGRGGFVAWFGYVFEWLQIIGLQPGTGHELARRLRAGEPPPAPGASAEVRGIVATARAPSARRAFRAISLMSNDNDVTILGLGLLSGQILTAQLVATIYAAVTLLVGIVLCQWFLTEAARTP